MRALACVLVVKKSTAQRFLPMEYSILLIVFVFLKLIKLATNMMFQKVRGQLLNSLPGGLLCRRRV